MPRRRSLSPVLESQIMDSELMHSIVGSYHKPPERVFVPSFTQNEPSQNCHPANLEVTSPKILHSPNSQALILALKTLQEKIHRLELERTQAEDNLNILSREAAQYKKALENETNERNLAHQELIKQKKDISIQLSSAQSRCTLLEKQLEYTKRMVLNVEREKNMILEQQDKIKHLEEKLKEEEHQRKLFQDKASELQTGLEISKIIMSSVSNLKHSKEKKTSSKKTKCIKRGPPWQICSKFGALPFVAEKSTSANCSVNASMQNLLQRRQHRGPHILQKPFNVAETRCLPRPSRTSSWCKAIPPDSEKSISISDNLSELLMAMQDELDQMSMEHQELLKQMKETESHSVCDDIECELECLVKKMEIKGEQISKLKKHQESVRKLQQKVQNSKMSEASGIQQEDSNPKGSKNIKHSPRKCLTDTNLFQKNSSFHPIRVHNLQMKLRRDDIMWEQ
ncbi:centrosomal protein CEP57L1 isoform X6 [Trachypithecus francoisi]|uniref:centrosomal protein CEP57L1 isoform X6 n=1 Tax=Trachypithecus francoisi TaxID=54180 RepID=UPI00141B06B6|nr:centrosomal protein CEP57L1 isoform X6 [Trachypithecus francoisi]